MTIALAIVAAVLVVGAGIFVYFYTKPTPPEDVIRHDRVLQRHAELMTAEHLRRRRLDTSSHQYTPKIVSTTRRQSTAPTVTSEERRQDTSLLDTMTAMSTVHAVDSTWDQPSHSTHSTHTDSTPIHDTSSSYSHHDSGSSSYSDTSCNTSYSDYSSPSCDTNTSY